jgi:hypothetical protein
MVTVHDLSVSQACLSLTIDQETTLSPLQNANHFPEKPEVSENRGVHMIHILETLSIYDEAELVRY